VEHSEEFVEQLVASAMAANSSPGWPEAAGGPAVFGFFGIAAAAAGIAKILFFNLHHFVPNIPGRWIDAPDVRM